MTIAATALVATDGTLASRLERLCDQGSFLALGGGAGDGAIAGRGRVAGRTVFLWANNLIWGMSARLQGVRPGPNQYIWWNIQEWSLNEG